MQNSVPTSGFYFCFCKNVQLHCLCLPGGEVIASATEPRGPGLREMWLGALGPSWSPVTTVLCVWAGLVTRAPFLWAPGAECENCFVGIVPLKPNTPWGERFFYSYSQIRQARISS